MGKMSVENERCFLQNDFSTMQFNFSTVPVQENGGKSCRCWYITGGNCRNAEYPASEAKCSAEKLFR